VLFIGYGEQQQVNYNIIICALARFVHADAFVYSRQLEISGQQFDVVLCDPPKLIESRDERETARGMRKYEDLNALAVGLVAPGGLLVTCSCSGLLSEPAFEEIVARAVHKRNRRMQVRVPHDTAHMHVLHTSARTSHPGGAGGRCWRRRARGAIIRSWPTVPRVAISRSCGPASSLEINTAGEGGSGICPTNAKRIQDRCVWRASRVGWIPSWP
jgi:hypothetical protein